MKTKQIYYIITISHKDTTLHNQEIKKSTLTSLLTHLQILFNFHQLFQQCRFFLFGPGSCLRICIAFLQLSCLFRLWNSLSAFPWLFISLRFECRGLLSVGGPFIWVHLMFAHDQTQAVYSQQEHLRDDAVFLSASHQITLVPPLVMLNVII